MTDMDIPTPQQVWGYSWRSSPWFIISAMAVALFTDTFLYSFIVPILPYMIEDRLRLDPSYTQRVSSWLLAETAAVSVVIRVPLGHFADKSASKRKWLLWALVIALVSALCVAVGHSLVALFIGRFVQGIASSIMWVVGLTTVADNVHLEHMGKIYTTVSMAAAVGTSAGPTLAGVLFQLAGYWVAWSTAFAIIGVDIIFRLLMLESPHTSEIGPALNRNADSERTPLLGNQQDESSPTTERAEPGFYGCIFRKRNFVGGIYCNFISGLLVTSFNATLPLHVREVFHWGGMPSGLMFAAIQAPRLVMSPFVGWLKDRVGTRTPTAFAFTSLTPLIWLLGIPGNDRFPGLNRGNRGPVLYVIILLFIGIQSAFLSGAGAIEATLSVNELGQEHPGAFGPNDGKSRALAIVGVAWTLGNFVGPVLAGVLNERVDYYAMNCVLAGICAVSAIVAFVCLRPKLS